MYLANAILEIQRRIDAHTACLKEALRVEEEREAAAEASRSLDEAMDVVDHAVFGGKTAPQQEEEKETPVSLATEDPVNIYRCVP